MSKLISSMYLIIVHVLLIVVLVVSDFISQVETLLGFNEPVLQEEVSEHYRSMLTYHGFMDDSVPEGAVVFIGDSITQGLYVSAIASPAVNYGIGGDTTLGVLQRLPKYRSLERAQTVVLAIGINDLPRRENQAIVDNYSLIINQFSDMNPVIVVSAVLPIDERASHLHRAGGNKRIQVLNAGLAKICKEFTKCSFFNAAADLVDSTGNLSATFHVGDGVHLNAAGYAVLINELKTQVNKSMVRLD